MKPEPTIDFDLLDLDARQVSALNRRAMAWLAGLLVVVLLSIVLLAAFLRSVEAQEESRRRAADAEWLDQLLRFHFRRLEADLGVLALQAQRRDADPPAPVRAGMLWRGAGVMAAHGWMPADRQPVLDRWPPFLRAAAADPDNAGALATMLDTTRGLQRAAYAEPLYQAAGEAGRTLWLAVPVFEQGRFLGDYVAAIRLDRALSQVVPAWFLKDHAITLLAGAAPDSALAADKPSRYVASVNLPGAQWKLAVDVLHSQPALAPRAFFAVALVCLSGMLVALYFLGRDAARRRRAESLLQTQLALRAAMERSVTLGLRAWDLNGRLLYVNQAFCRMAGWPAQALLAHAGPAPYGPAGQGAEGPMTRPAPADATLVGQELPLRHRDGHTLEVLVHGAPLTLADGTAIGWIESALDITERKRIERLAARQHARLQASARLVAVGEVASTLAHELNQPLGALSSFANGLLNRVRQRRITQEEIVQVVERMERMAEKAGRVIQRVNAFARRQEMTSQPLELTSFIRRVAGQVPLPDGLQLQMRLPDTGVNLPADAVLLEHALHNVVLNATEWAVHGGRVPALVRVSLEQTGTMVGIRIEDSGPGVPAEQQDSIFDAFASQKAGGMGMGLSICRSIIEAHHGRVEVDRSDELKGAKFTLWLPLNP